MVISKVLKQALPRYMKEEDYTKLCVAIQEIHDTTIRDIDRDYTIYPSRANIIYYISRYIRNEIFILPDGIEQLESPVSGSFRRVNIDGSDDVYDYTLVIFDDLQTNDRQRLKTLMERINPYNKTYNIIYRFSV